MLFHVIVGTAGNALSHHCWRRPQCSFQHNWCCWQCSFTSLLPMPTMLFHVIVGTASDALSHHHWRYQHWLPAKLCCVIVGAAGKVFTHYCWRCQQWSFMSLLALPAMLCHIIVGAAGNALLRHRFDVSGSRARQLAGRQNDGTTSVRFQIQCTLYRMTVAWLMTHDVVE